MPRPFLLIGMNIAMLLSGACGSSLEGGEKGKSCFLDYLKAE
jgi:hypothetical protein